MISSRQTFLVFQDALKTSRRGLQRNTFRLPRRLKDVFKTYLQYVFLKRLENVIKTTSKRLSRRIQDIFKTCLQHVFQLCLQDVKTSWKTKKCYTKDVFNTSSPRRMFAGLRLFTGGCKELVWTVGYLPLNPSI